ncbi:hypothetical protein [Nonomuraea sp. NPDC048901]|uniref:hypothetical protein n=1 Tax=unclassified Nonomuraea TaxID=2593643 RepID=UPI0033E3E9BB
MTAATAANKGLLAGPLQYVRAAVVVAALVVLGLRPRPSVPMAEGKAPSPWAVFATVGALVARWSHRSGWSDAHRLALAAGAMLTYAWHSFPWEPVTTEPVSQAVDLTSNAS